MLDAGASGHALQLLRMPAATAGTFESGIAHREASRVARVLADPARTAVHVVALPEEMPLEEAAEVIERLRSEPRLPVGRLVINQCRPPAPGGAAEVVASLRASTAIDPARSALSIAAGRVLGWLRIQEDGIAALERRVGLRAERLPKLEVESFSLGEVHQLAARLKGGFG